VLIPEGEGPFPAVVLVHGGAWMIGNPSSIQPLADFMTENGYLTVNTTYQLALQGPGFPTAIEDVACAVRFAASHPLSDGTVTLIGHSAGAHIGSVVALTGSDYLGECPFSGSGLPNRFIGLAGPYDVFRLGPIMTPFFGSQRTEQPDDWDDGNPMLHVGDNLELDSLLLHGDLDQVVPPDFSENFYEALLDAGASADFVLLEGVDHSGAQNPQIVGDIILDWLRP
jgi:acetyl esterase/lipase